MQVKLILHIEDVADEPKSEPKSEPKQLTKRQYRILQAISIDNTLTREQISQQIKVPLGTIKRDISFLRNEGFLDRSGGNTYGTWIILKDID